MRYLNAEQEWSSWKKLIKDEHDLLSLEKLSPEEIKENFSYNFSFGTAGIRAQLGWGWNKLNKYSVRKVAISYLLYLRDKIPLHILKNSGVVIFHDNRAMSEEFSIEIAKLYTDANIKVFLSPKNHIRPTPFCSYAIRQLQAVAGIMITASHNPKNENGIKLYNSQGSQLLTEETSAIEQILDKFDRDIFSTSPKGINELTIMTSETLDNDYVEAVKSLCFYPSLPKKVKVIYSPLGGTGSLWGKKICEELGYTCHAVEEESIVNSEFSNINYLNPENPLAFTKSINLAKKLNGNLIFLNDPDADRLGVAYLNDKHEYTILSGNEIAIFLVHFLLTQYQFMKQNLKHFVLYKTYVSSSYPALLASKYEVQVETVYTGFKYLADKIMHAKPHEKLLLAYEEALGFLVNPIVLDKDGFQPMVLFLDAVNYYKNNHKTIDEVFHEIYQENGYCKNASLQFTFNKDKEDIKNISKIFNFFKNQKISSIGQIKIVDKKDFSHTNILNKADLIILKTEENDSICIRPSGTEPKIKFYFEIYAKEKEILEEKLAYFQKAFDNAIKKIIETN